MSRAKRAALNSAERARHGMAWVSKGKVRESGARLSRRECGEAVPWDESRCVKHMNSCSYEWPFICQVKFNVKLYIIEHGVDYLTQC